MTGTMQQLDRLFQPGSVAVVGASTHEAGIGNRVLSLLEQHGFPGQVFAVNPKYSRIGDVPCYPDVASIPVQVDLVVVAVRQDSVIEVVRECAAASVGTCIIMSAGLGEGGSGAEELAELRSILHDSSMRIMGPNSLGVFSPLSRLAATFSVAADRRKDMHELRHGGVAILTQSGALGFFALQALSWAGIGIGVVASPGNSIDLDVSDFAQYWLARPEIVFVSAVIEEIKDVHKMRALGESVRASGKPMAVLKLGRSAIGQRASLSHTGAMAGAAEVYSGFFRQYGLIEVSDTAELAALANLFSRKHRRFGRRVCVITASGGGGIMLTDILSAHGLRQPETSPQLAQRLLAMLPPHAAVLNPVDITAQATANADRSGGLHAQEAALQVLVDSGEYDAVITYLPLGARTADRLADTTAVADSSATPVILYSGGALDDDSVARVRESQLPWFNDATLMAKALAAAADWSERAAESAGPTEVAVPGTAVRDFGEVVSSLERAGIGLVGELEAHSPEEAAARAAQLGFPVVVKLDARDVPHKTELGGVRVGIRDEGAAADAAEAILHSAAQAGHPDAGLVVQRMVSGVEALVSYRNDEKFGPVVVLGVGGTQTELLRSIAVRLAPVTRAEAHDMIREVRLLSTMLDGFRGSPPADREALADYLVEFSRLAAAQWGAIDEVEVNPLIVQAAGSGVAAVDLLVATADSSSSTPTERQES